MSARARRAIWGGLLAAAFVAAQGCGPSDPLEMTVKADTYVGFSMWRERARDRLDPAQMADFEEALQELRFRTMANGKATGSAGIEEATLADIDGRSIRYVLELGLGSELRRLQSDHSQLDLATYVNALARVRPGDTDSADHLRDLIERQGARLREVDDRIAAIQRKLFALNPERDRDDGTQPPPAPATPQPAAPSPTDSPPQRIGRGKTQTPGTTQNTPWTPHRSSESPAPSNASPP